MRLTMFIIIALAALSAELSLAQSVEQNIPRTKAESAFTAQDSAVRRATYLTFDRARIGQHVIVNASFSPNICNNPQSKPILACKIGNAPEERMPLDERFSYKNSRMNSNNWSNKFRFGYVPADAKQIIIRALWVRGADTLTLRTDTAKPVFTILSPSYGITNSLGQENKIALLSSSNQDSQGNTIQSLQITLTQIAPPYNVQVPVQVIPRAGSVFPEILYATTGSIALLGKAPYIDYAASSLAIFAGNEPDTSIHWKCTPETLRLKAIRPNADYTSLQADIDAQGIPLPTSKRDSYSLRGLLVLRYGYTVSNPFNGMIDSMPVRRMMARIHTTFIHDKAQEEEVAENHVSSASFRKWLRSYVSETPLPENLRALISAQNLNVHILRFDAISSALLERLYAAFKIEPKERDFKLIGSLRNDCDIWSKLEWNTSYGLPKPVKIITESSAPQECEQLWEIFASRYVPTRFSGCVVFLDEISSQNINNTSFSDVTSAKILALVPFGAHTGELNAIFPKEATMRDCIMSALNPNNPFRKKSLTYQDLQTISLFSEKKDDRTNESFRNDNIIPKLKSKTIAQYADTLLHQQRYSKEVQSERASQASYKDFLAWSDTATTLKDAPFHLMEADTSAMARIREQYREGYGINEASEKVCSATEEIKRYAAKGKPIPFHLTAFDEVEDECRSVAWFYENTGKAINIHRVLVGFATSGVNKGLPMFAVCIGASLRDSAAITKPLTEQVRKPYMHTLLSAETLKNLACERLDGECPLPGSMQTEYRTLYDYCTMKTRQGKFTERTADVLLGHKR